jgi:putative tributyrin esterase
MQIKETAMAFIQAGFYSKSLSKQCALYAIIPETGRGPFPCFYLLHGYSDDHSIWLRRTRIEQYVSGLPLIVIMPDGFHGFYTDHEEGPAYGTYMTEDVIGFCENTFPVARKRASRCIGGLSMGGYGAMRVGLGHPEMFASITSHSAATRAWDLNRPGRSKAHLHRMFGTRPDGSKHDLAALAKKIKRSGRPAPKLRIDCGTEDSLIDQNRKLHADLTKMNFAHEYEEFPGDHNWDYWDTHVQRALKFHAQALRLNGKE